MVHGQRLLGNSRATAQFEWLPQPLSFLDNTQNSETASLGDSHLLVPYLFAFLNLLKGSVLSFKVCMRHYSIQQVIVHWKADAVCSFC